MHMLPATLVDRLSARIADPLRRHFRDRGERLGAFQYPQEVAQLMDESPLGNGDIFREMLAKMAEWGHSNPTFHVTRGPNGEIGASTDDKHAYALAPPATPADLRALEAAMGRELPSDLKQMWEIADGGWGPGFSFTTDRGPGLHSVSGARVELEDLRRRGPGYTGEMEWPAHLLPLTNGGRGMISYDLDTGHIVSFNDYWYDEGINSIEDAFPVTYLSLGEWLAEWLES